MESHEPVTVAKRVESTAAPVAHVVAWAGPWPRTQKRQVEPAASRTNADWLAAVVPTTVCVPCEAVRSGLTRADTENVSRVFTTGADESVAVTRATYPLDPSL